MKSVVFIIFTISLTFNPFLVCILGQGVVSGSHSSTKYVETGLKVHNNYRTAHKTPTLELDSRLVHNAMSCARYYAQIRGINHTCPCKELAGENLYWTSATYTDLDFEVKRATDLWYDEIKNYDYNRNDAKEGKKFKDIGHFTQLVWKGSKKLGIGIAKVAWGTYVVALYDPHGNINVPTMFTENVLPHSGGFVSIAKTLYLVLLWLF